MWTGNDSSVTKVTNYGFDRPAVIKCGELQSVLCIFHKLLYSTGSLNIASTKRDFCDNINISIGYGLEDNLQIVQEYKHDVMPATGGEAVQHQGTVQGVTTQGLGDSKATTETDGLRHFIQTRSADVPRQVQRDPEDGSGPLQGQVNHQQAWQLNVSGLTCQPLGFGRTKQHKPVLMIRFEPFCQEPKTLPSSPSCQFG